MTTSRRVGVATAVLTMVGVPLLAAACGSTGASSTGSTSAPAQPPTGGTLVIGASQEPGCADWYAPCGGSSWGNDTMASQTLPAALAFHGGQYHVTPLLAGEPVLDPGPPQRVTFHINPKAVWSDGQPVTSTDVKYTVAQARGLDRARSISSVDDTDARTVVMSFSAPTAAWRDSLTLRILPSHILQGNDRTAVMRNGYSFSAGPWIIDHWTRGQEIKLVPNPRYWDRHPHLDAVVFKIITDTSAYFAAYRTGQVAMAYVQGAEPQAAELKSVADTHFQVSLGLAYEYLVLNTQKSPLDSLAVRQALAYATDRDAIVTQLLGPLMPGITPAQALMSPGNRTWYSEPFKKYTRDLGDVTRLMTSDGWARGSDGIWANGGARASLDLSTAAGNQRLELIEQILQSEWKEAGFEATVNNSPAPTLYGDRLPHGNYQVAIVGRVPPSADPALCSSFCSHAVGNYSGIASKELDTEWQAVNSEGDTAHRVQLVHQAQQALADLVPAIPISGTLDIVVYNAAKVGGPVTTNPTGVFYNLNEWYCKEQCH